VQRKQTPQNWQNEAADVLGILHITLNSAACFPALLHQSVSVSPRVLCTDDKLCSVYMCCAGCL